MKKFQSLGKNLSSKEQKKILGGMLAEPSCSGSCDYVWTDYQGMSHTTTGTCQKTSDGKYCYCSNGVGSCS